MTARRAVWEVARREIVERSRSRAWRVALAVLLVAAAGGAVAAARLGDRTPTDRIGVVGARSAALEPAIRAQAKAAGRRVRLRRFAGVRAASEAVRDGSVAVALVDAERIVARDSAGTAGRIVREAVAAERVLERLDRAGLSRDQALRALTPEPVPVQLLDPGARDVESNRTLIAIGVITLLATLLSFGQAVAQSVTEEKSSRVVELVLTTVSPRRLLAGKVLGVGLLGLGLVLLPGAVALLAGTLAGGAGLPPAAPKTFALVVLWFVLGYVFYSVAFAAVGALVSRQEDLQTAMIPLTGVLLAGFLIADVVANTSPDGTLGQIATFVPPFAPMVVPARMVLGDLGAAGLLGAIALDVVATIGMIVLASRVYERAILRTGAPVKLRRVLALRTSTTAPRGASPMDHRDDTHDAGTGGRIPPLADVALRMTAVVLLIAGVVIGFDQPVAIVLVALGVLAMIVQQVLRQLPRRPEG